MTHDECLLIKRDQKNMSFSRAKFNTTKLISKNAYIHAKIAPMIAFMYTKLFRLTTFIKINEHRVKLM